MTETIANGGTPATDAPGSGERADALRAMSSPICMRILGTLRIDGEQTVSQIGERIGVATGAVSYHLGQLAGAGLVEKAPSSDGDRRKSWWSARQRATDLDGGADRGDPVAKDMFRRSAALSHEMAYERFLDRLPALGREWSEACTNDDHVMRLTPLQSRELIGEINEVIRKWEDRASGPGEDGAEPVALTLQVFRWIP